MACPKKEALHFLNENNWLIQWCDDFYLSIIECNFLAHLKKFNNVFELLSILRDISKINLILEKDKYLEKLFILEKKWRGNELSIKKLGYELKRKIFELKEEKVHYKIIILLTEMKVIIDNKKLDDLKDEFCDFKNSILEKLKLDIWSSFEKNILVKKLEMLLENLHHKPKKTKNLYNFIY